APAGLAPDGERDRDRKVRPEPAAGLQAGAPVRRTHRGDLPARRNPRREMMDRSRKIRLGLVVLLAAGIFGYRYYQDNVATADTTTAPPRMYGDIAFRPCTLSSPFGVDGIEAQCGTYAVPENPAEPDGRQVALNIAWVLPDEGAEVTPDPVFLLAGGPGQA